MIKNLLRSLRKIIHYEDDYLELLRKVNAGMLHHGNLYCFYYAIKNLPSSNPIVEVGTFLGLSANTMTYFKKMYDKDNLIISVDKIKRGDDGVLLGKSNIELGVFNKYIRDSLKNNLLTFSKDDLPFIIEKSSDSFFEMWQSNENAIDLFNREVKLGGGISFAYIDGNHGYEYVLNDFTNCDKYLDKNGFILFDDSADFSDWEVTRVVKELKKNKAYKVVLKNPNYLFQKVS